MYRLLLVDDEKMVLVSIRHSVSWEQYGFIHIQETTSPHEALRILEESRIDTAFVDIRMPELSAFDILNYCQQLKLSTTFVILTGYSDFNYVQQAFRLNVFDYLLKPLQPEDTEAFIPRLLDSVRSKRLQEDPSIYKALLKGEKLLQRLTYLGIDMAKPYLGILHISSNHPIPIPLDKEALHPIGLIIQETQLVLFFAADENPTIAIKDYIRQFTAPCGAAFQLVSQDIEHLPSALMNLKRDSEDALAQSIRSKKNELLFSNSLGTHRWNTSFLQLIEEIEAHYQEDISLSELAEKYKISYSYCSSLFTSLLGTSFSQYLFDLRMQHARDLLEQTELPIGIISEQVGYHDYHYFAKSFKKVYDQTPSEYRTSKRS